MSIEIYNCTQILLREIDSKYYVKFSSIFTLKNILLHDKPKI